MKKTLKEKIESLLKRVNERLLSLSASLNEYHESGNYQEALKTEIKIDQWRLVAEELENALK